jgi:hypothetical protein
MPQAIRHRATPRVTAMANRAGRQELLIAKRVQALAIMYLTRRSDLTVEEVREDTGLDLLVRLVPEGKEGVREFGVELRGALSSVSNEHADKVLRPSVRQAHRAGPFGFSVCLFFFTMDDNKAWYTWIAEPVVRAGKALLQSHEDADCRRLDNGTLDEIVDRVDRWYDAFFENLVLGSANGSPSGRKSGS